MKAKILIGLCIFIAIMQIVIIYKINYPKEDVNKDGKVNALDLLIVQKKILENKGDDK